MHRALALLAVALVAVVAAAPAAGKAVKGGTLVIGRGVDVEPQAKRIELGMKRKAVVKALGRPLAQNEFGYLRYGRSRDGVFDLFVDAARDRVDLIVVSLPGVCTRRGICLFEPGGLDMLRAQYGAGLRRAEEAGGVVYRIGGTFGERRVTTDFTADGEGPEAQLTSVSLYLHFT